MSTEPYILSEPNVSLGLARLLIAGAEAEATRRGIAMAIAVVDRAGQLLAAARQDGATPVALQLAVDKAFTAAAFGYPTDAWAEVTRPGGADWGLTSALSGRIVILAGGLPLKVDGRLVGGLGVSGAAPAVDLACAVEGLRAVGATLDQPAIASPSSDD